MIVSTLRARILGTLATSTLIAAACGGETSTSSSSGGTGSSSSGSSGASSGSSGASSGSSGASSGSSGASSGSSGTSSGTVPVTCTSGQKERTCYAPESVPRKGSNVGGDLGPDASTPTLPPPVLDPNGCLVLEQVENGCCNPAVSGPSFEGGKCCYEFCAGSCCGRPLLVDQTARVAAPKARTDWTTGAASLVPSALDATTRSALRASWTADALLEHASIASFASFTLELLAVGAPPELLRDAQRAASDEIEHARLTFAIASRYTDAPVGPGALDVSGVAPSPSLAAVAAACVRDGCINETIASAIAGAQAANADDATLGSTLTRIAEDEARHAELAWRFVQWALATGEAGVREAVRAAFDVPIAPARPLADGVDAASWRSHGRLLPSEHTHLVESVVAQVIRPCRDRLLNADA